MTPADTSIQSIVLWVAALSTLVSFGSVIWSIFSGPSRKNSTRLDEHGKRLDAHEMKLSEIAQTQHAMPSSKEMHELEIAMEQLKGELRTLTAVMSGQSAIMERLESIVSRHDNHLLEGGGRR